MGTDLPPYALLVLVPKFRPSVARTKICVHKNCIIIYYPITQLVQSDSEEFGFISGLSPNSFLISQVKLKAWAYCRIKVSYKQEIQPVSFK